MLPRLVFNGKISIEIYYCCNSNDPTMTHFGSSIRDAHIIKIFLKEKKFQETKDEP